MNNEDLKRKCNALAEQGITPYGLIKTSKELKTRPNSVGDIFEKDEYPEIVEVFDSAEAATKAVEEQGTACISYFSYGGGKGYCCCGYFAAGLLDLDEDGETWEIDFDEILNVETPVPEEPNEENDEE